jgi:hypothetical protein
MSERRKPEPARSRPEPARHAPWRKTSHRGDNGADQGIRKDDRGQALPSDKQRATENK